jgi:cobalt/nickel transport system permease protein
MLMRNLLEPLSPKHTFLHRLDARIKLSFALAFILICSMLESVYVLAGAAFLLLVVLKAVGTPWPAVMQRLAWVLLFSGALIVFFPFLTPGKEVFSLEAGPVGITATQEGFSKAMLYGFRLLTAILAFTLLKATTGFREIMAGLRLLHVPAVLVSIIEFTIRYFFVLGDELARMKLARQARAYNLKRSIFCRRTGRILTQLLAVLFVRSLERAERVYLAMLARGYGGVKY